MVLKPEPRNARNTRNARIRTGGQRLPLPDFTVVPEAGLSRFDRILFGEFDLLCTELELFVALLPAFFTGERRCSAFAPIIFNGRERERCSAEQSE